MTVKVRPLATIEDYSDRFPVIGIGNAWSRLYYDGPFHIFAAPPDLPAISLVFVQTRDGNTGASNPADLGGGPTDKHLLYEGLSRVAADGVLAGASSVGHSVFFTVHHPEMVALRQELGFPRHPAQMVMSNDGHFDGAVTELERAHEGRVTARVRGRAGASRPVGTRAGSPKLGPR